MNPVQLVTSALDAGKRLDHFLAEQFPGESRSRLQSWIRDGLVRLNAQPQRKPSALLKPGESVEVQPAARPPLKATPEDLPLEILFEDDAVIAVNKPAGLVVHAGAGHHQGTLVNRLVHRFRNLSSLGGDLRPGIVHRLDRYTSGVLLVAKTDRAHRALAAQFANRTTEKTYIALVERAPKPPAGSITAPISRDPVRRTRMTTRNSAGRDALTTYQTTAILDGGRFTLLEVRIGTGRTHQIRVHLASIGHPVAGDHLYGAAANPPGQPEPERFFLHAASIRFISPDSRRKTTVQAPLPGDLAAWLDLLRSTKTKRD